MSFIAKNPLVLPEINTPPSPPMSGARGLFAKEDGWYSVDAHGKASKLSTDVDRANSYKYYGNAGVVPSDHSIFKFEIDVTKKTATLIRNEDYGTEPYLNYEGTVNIPYEYIVKDGDNAGVYKVTKIDSRAFMAALNLDKIRVPNTVLEIGNQAFETTGLTSVELPDSIISIGNSIFSSCQNLKTFVVPSKISSIPPNAYSGCKKIDDIYIPDNITTIDERAFFRCEELNTITIAASVSVIGDGAFQMCSNITDVYFEGSKEQWDKIDIKSDNECLLNATIHFDCVPATEGFVNEKLKNIPEGELVDAENFLTKEEANKSYKYYGDAGVIPSKQDLFNFEINTTNKTAKIVGEFLNEWDGYGIINLSGDIVIPYEYKITEGENAGVYKVTELGEYSFNGSDITSVRIPNTITTIGQYAFQRCKKLSTITFPSSVYDIGEGVCEYSGLMWVYFEGSLSTIPSHAFRECAIAEITLPKYVYTIGDYAFYENVGLNNITIPSSLRTVGRNAFEYCYDVRDVWYQGTEEEWSAISFGDGNIIFDGAPIHYKSVPATEGYVDEQIKNISMATYSYVNILGGYTNWVLENVTDSSGKVIGSRYGQVVYDYNNNIFNVHNATITPNSKVDLQITSEQMVVFYEKSLAFVAENDGGVVTVYCVGAIPQNNYTMQAIITEVVING